MDVGACVLSTEREMECRKRSRSEGDLLHSLEQKRPRTSFYTRLESDIACNSEDDTESVYSIQEKETDVVQDSTYYEFTDSELDSESQLLTLEYEVESLSSDADFPAYSSSGTEDVNIQAAAEGAFAAVLFDTSMERWETDADTSDGSISFGAFDFEECRGDFETCLQCKLHNNNPSYRYCDKCFQKCWQCRTRKTFKGFPLCIGCYKVRKTFFPPRPKPRKRKHHDESENRQHADTLGTLQNFLTDMEERRPANQVSLPTPILPNMNFADIVVPQKHLKRAAANSSTRTHDADSDSDSGNAVDEHQPPRKKRCKSDRQRDESSANDTASLHSDDLASKHSLGESTTDHVGCSQDSGIRMKLLPSSQETTDSCADNRAESQVTSSRPCANANASTMVLSVCNLTRHTAETQPVSDSDLSNCNTGSSDCQKGPTTTSTAPSAASSDAEMCIMCMSAPKNGIFLHGGIGHMCCCYKCSMRVWKNCKRCPVCNCKVNNVVKLFIT